LHRRQRPWKLRASKPPPNHRRTTSPRSPKPLNMIPDRAQFTRNPAILQISSG
jgi:hypothetical protein